MELNFILWLLWAFFASVQVFLWYFELGGTLPKLFWWSLGAALTTGWLANQAEKVQMEVEDIVRARFLPSKSQVPDSSPSSEAPSQKPAELPPPPTPQHRQRSPSPPESPEKTEAPGASGSSATVGSSAGGLCTPRVLQRRTEKILKKPRL